MPFEFEKTDISEVIIVTPKVFGDDRGFFMETYKKEDFVNNGIKGDFIQDNHSKSVKNVLRGLHYQLTPYAQDKLVRCIKGKILDVAVDLRKSSKTFKKWVAVELTDANKKMMYIPKGFAHGFLTLSDEAEIVYKSTNIYSPKHDRSVLWNDPEIGIDWTNLASEFILSEKDKNAVLLKDAEIFE